MVVDGLEAATVRSISRACREPDHKVPFGSHSDVIARFADRRVDPQRSIRRNRHIHEYVEGARYLIGTDPERRQGLRQIAKAPAMDRMFGIEMAECRLAAWREQEVMRADRIFEDGQKYLRSVGPQPAAGCHP